MGDTRRFICGWAQNNTALHGPLWANLRAYARHRKAEVLVVKGKYNPGYNPYTHGLDELEEEISWDKQAVPFLAPESVVPLGANCDLHSEVPILATAQRPLSGLQGHGHHRSGVFGAPKWHLECRAVIGAKYPKLQQTTGALTVENYSDSKAGAKAQFHHMFGFTIVEVVDGVYFHMRRVCAESRTGAFFDTSGGKVYRVEGGQVSVFKGESSALMIGDSHAEESCERAVEATLDQIRVLRPKRRLANDILSASAQSHHNVKNVYANWRRRQSGGDCVALGLGAAQELLKRLGVTDVLDSNHHEHLDRWCDDPRGHFDPVNSHIWHHLNWLKRTKGIESAFEAWCRSVDGAHADGITWHKCSGSCVIDDVAFVHGHEGVDGARGLRAHGDKTGRKTVGAHIHAPYGLGGFDVVGHTSEPQHDYNSALMSSWLQGNLVLYPNGKRQHLHIIRDCPGMWRTAR